MDVGPSGVVPAATVAGSPLPHGLRASLSGRRLDMAQFSDDISALWGRGDDAVLSAEPRPAEPRPLAEPVPPPPPDSAKGDDERLSALEDSVRRLAQSLEAHRSALDAKVADELGRLRAETLTATETRLAEIEAGMAQRVDEIGQQMATALSRAAVPGPVPGPEADRLDMVERQLHEGMTRLHRSLSAFHAQTVAKTDLDAVRSERTGLVRDQLARIQAEAVAAAASRLAAIEARVDERLRAVPHPTADGDAAPDGDRLQALERRVGEDVARLTQAVQGQDARFVKRTELKTLWDSLKTTLTQNLRHARAQAVADAEANLAAAKVELEERIRRLEQAVGGGPAVGEPRAEPSSGRRSGTG